MIIQLCIIETNLWFMITHTCSAGGSKKTAAKYCRSQTTIEAKTVHVSASVSLTLPACIVTSILHALTVCDSTVVLKQTGSAQCHLH